jgi:signal transduction histidine kinase
MYRARPSRMHDEMAQHRQVLGVVGHELRAPLAAIMIGTEMLLAQHDPIVTDVAVRIASFTKRMARMVDQVLDATRAQLGGTIPIARCSVSLSHVLESVIDELSAEFPSNRLSVAGSAEIKGLWDPDRLREALTALVTNGVRYGRKDGPIHITLSRVDGKAVVAVHNELREAAISTQDLTSLFDPYMRGDEPDNGAGLGLGLFLVREIVRAHAGMVTAASLSTGTTFRLELPLVAG